MLNTKLYVDESTKSKLCHIVSYENSSGNNCSSVEVNVENLDN